MNRILVLLLPATLLAQDAPKRRVSDKYREIVKQIETTRKTKLPSCSTGEPNDAKLLNAAELPVKGYGYRIGNPDRKTNFGTDEMVFGLMIVGAEMMERYGKDGVFFVGDISRQEGGKLKPHISHQGGRDVDLGFYLCDDKLRPQGNRMETIDKEGKAKSGNLRFDLQRNWDFLCFMMDSPFFGEDIRFILISDWIRDLILKYAKERFEKSKNPLERDYLQKHIKRAEKDLSVKNDHDNHFHLRIKCTREDNKEG